MAGGERRKSPVKELNQARRRTTDDSNAATSDSKDIEIIDITSSASSPPAKRRRTKETKDDNSNKEKNKNKAKDKATGSRSIKNRRDDPPGDGKPISMMTCCVCFDSPNKCAVTPCGHLYCTDCIYRALTSITSATKATGVCSICRRKLSYSDVTFLELRVASTEKDSKDKDSNETELKEVEEFSENG